MLLLPRARCCCCWWLFCSPFLLLLLHRLPANAGAEPLPSSPRLVRTVQLGNVSLVMKVHFAENTSLADDIQLLDRMFASSERQAKEEEERKKEEQEAAERRRKRAEEDGVTARARLLLVGDHSLFEKFLRLYGEDEYAAFNGLFLYLGGIFSQLQSIYGQVRFFGRFGLRLQLAGPPMVVCPSADCPVHCPPLPFPIVLRAQDCPLRGPMLTNSALQHHQPFAPGKNVSSSAVLPPPPSSNSSSNSSSSVPIQQPGDGADDSVHHWDRLDALKAVQWTSKWVRGQQLTAAAADNKPVVLPRHEHLLLVTALDLLSQQLDSSTQGMAYVRAMCRGSDSVSMPPIPISVVEDVGGLGTATVAAHELAHSLGAFHDGSGDSENCTARQNFLMAPLSAAHPFDAQFGDTFDNAFLLSACSRAQIEAFFNSSDSECLWQQNRPNKSPPFLLADWPPLGHRVRGAAQRASRPVLEQQAGREEEEAGEKLAETGGQPETGGGGARVIRPGEQFHPGRQCQIAFGPSYGLCQRRDLLLASADPCRRLWCKDRRQRRWTPCETKGFLPLMDGTRCGEAKWCLQGRCRAGNNTASGDASSPDCADLNRPFCRNFSQTQLRSFCPVSTFSRLCCASCRPFPGRTRGGGKGQVALISSDAGRQT